MKRHVGYAGFLVSMEHWGAVSPSFAIGTIFECGKSWQIQINNVLFIDEVKFYLEGCINNYSSNSNILEILADTHYIMTFNNQTTMKNI